ncbi:MAG: SDR family oxidoreductase [Myxococcota bacterium]|nr:SDR family oxidoreductase [Myxococcota bacterium]
MTDELPFDVEEVIGWLESLVLDRKTLWELPESQRQRLLVAAGRLSHPKKGELRQMRKDSRRVDRAQERQAVDSVLSRTGIRKLRRALIYVTPPVLAADASAPAAEANEGPGELPDAKNCYVCKTSFREVHHFYDQLCARCAELNWEKRHQSADLRGRVALITGARVKIGYHAAIKLLRAGARVIVTTRFPRDAAARYAREEDFAEWQHRLSVYGLDLRHTPSVEAFCAHLDRSLERLDFIINNACQTVRRPTGFYRHLIADELRPASELPEGTRALLEGHESLHLQDGALARSGGRIVDPVALAQVALTDEDHGDLALFPEGKLDADLQQVDLRGRNSWRLLLHEVSTLELLEVQLVNAVAPYVLNGRLRALMNRVPAGTKKTRDKHIVNVSAMEGQFYRAFKTDRHPHTNMAKAALNMMTRTSATDYAVDGIHMNSVDTGWITDEDPADIAAKKVEDKGFSPPLDVVDGAARIVDPVFDGMRTGKHRFGLFLKDYAETPW